MQEQTQSTRTRTNTGGGLGGVFDNNAPFAPTVTVRHGVHTEHTHANQTVGEVRDRLRDRLGLSDEASAFVDGREVDADTRIIPGQTLTFMRKAGEKGAQPLRARIAFGNETQTKKQTITVRCGMFLLNVQSEGESVAHLRQQFQKQLAIPSDAHAICDGQMVEEDELVFPGQRLDFIILGPMS